MDEKKSSIKKVTRRDFLKIASVASAAMIVPRRVLGGPGFVPPSDRINLAMIGVGGQGCTDMRNFMRLDDVQVIAVCDANKRCDYSKFYFGGEWGWEPARDLVNSHYSQKFNKEYKDCKAYVDLREMLDKENDIDAVSIATTDNWHALAAAYAIKEGKHVYCQKPLTHDVYEARYLTEAARKKGVITQMGNQGHAGEANRNIVEWVADGAIGDVYEVHCWTDRPGGRWPQGLEVPEEIPSVPPGLDWKLWLGPAPFRPYHPIFVPFQWRGFKDFGTGSLGDMGCHIIDTPVWALDLKNPISVESTITSPFYNDSFPVAATVKYQFPAKGDKPGIKMYWYEGGLTPFRPEELEEGRRMGNNDGGTLLIGTKGIIMCGGFGDGARLIPETAMRAYTRPEPTIPRVEGIYEDFINGCKTGQKPCSNFDVSGPLTEIVLLGNVAMQIPNKKLLWDAKEVKITNDDRANKIVKREYQHDWKLEIV